MIAKKQLRYYIDPNGKAPFSLWLDLIKDLTTRSRIERWLERVELGNYGDYKALGDGLYELRFTFGSGYRVYFSELDDVVVILLCGGDKSSQRKDIKLAKRYWDQLRGNPS